MTRAYEIAVLLNPELSDAELERLGHSLKTLFSKFGGEVTSEDHWGRKSTAYPVQKHKEAYYAFFSLEISPDKVFELDQAMKLTENVLRHLITLKEEETEERA